MNRPVSKILCHNSKINAIAINNSGRYMATTGNDSILKTWDVRKFKPLHCYLLNKPITTLDISERNLLAVGNESKCEIWKNPFIKKQYECYLRHNKFSEKSQCVKFCPYEDFLGISYLSSFENIIVPGSGIPNFDTFENNPYSTERNINISLVSKLLDK